MADPNLQYDPITGFNDASVFVTNPATQADTRTMFQRLFTQVQTFINVTLIVWINNTFVAKTELQTELQGVVLGQIPNDSLTEAQMANEMKKGVVDGVESYNDAADNLYQVGDEISGLKNIWYPPTQPASSEIVGVVDGIPSLWETLWDSLMAFNSSYISKAVLGKDTTDTYDILKYEFTPANYNKTIIISANIHGGEVEGQKILYRFLYHLTHDYLIYPQLKYIRENVKIIIVPLLNPSGMVLSTRKNANGVDLNRNADYNWTNYVSVPADTTYKGVSVFSEVESQYIKSVLEANPNALAYLDIHNTAPNSLYHYYYATPESIDSKTSLIVAQVINSIKTSATTPSKVLNEVTDEPIVSFYACKQFGMSGGTIEWTPGALTGTAFTPLDMQEGLKFVGNVIIQHCAISVNRKITQYEGSAVHIVNNAQFNITSLTYVEVDTLSVVLNVPCDGVLNITGGMIIEGAGTCDPCFISPVIQQANNVSLGTTANQQNVNEIYLDTSGRKGTIPITASEKVKAFTDISVKFYGKVTTGGTLLHKRSRIVIAFVPAQKSDRLTFYYCASGGTILNKTSPIVIS